ncbi:16S rRNA (cytosine(967)-C(5))-methyltransferase RsmB [Fontisphaera persica]|uniref:16S rRNA (cytosine(967)-C(5))-methyltransferase RsmB n=1 Tax=Fontisphaera persica TaxID=2974023 RepID=UPI0024BF54F1|nr:16S rRNA (cytosine(967)-C(5))-methyltransferase RsmB [Fontisphaera persica]WCJ61250.1 16S rRNA (cytosine(967)-C(5))-methyltransferase RsmB [Fontisphaera persica]
MKAQNPREIAARILLGSTRGAGFVENRLESELARHALVAPDQRLVMELVYGVIRWQATLDHLIDRQVSRRKPEPRLRQLLRLGLYQMFWLDRIPDHAAVHETVSLARRLGCDSGAGFLNAVLRAFARQKESTRQYLAELKQNRPALGYSHPQWLVDRWLARWGEEDVRRFLDWNNTPPPLWVRVNTLKWTVADLQARWRQEGVEFEPFQADWLPEGWVFRLKEHPPLSSLVSFATGGFYVQDPSTLLAPLALEPQPGQTILDACAAPGGKTTFIAQLVRNEAIMTAWDASPERLQRLRENLERLGAAKVTVAAADWDAAPEAVYDRILLDVPCSNTGVMRRRVELRWRLQPQEIQRLARQQSQLLNRAARRLRPGGRLVYSTCSVEPEENQGVVHAFLLENPQWKCLSEKTLLPFKDHVDGAYIAVLTHA